MPRGWRPILAPRSAPVIRSDPSVVKTSNSTAVSRTFDPHNANAVGEMVETSGAGFITAQFTSPRRLHSLRRATVVPAGVYEFGAGRSHLRGELDPAAHAVHRPHHRRRQRRRRRLSRWAGRG